MTIKQRAHNAVSMAVRSGLLIRPRDCSRCSRTSRIHGHHADYTKPLEVEWLCVSCHKSEHPSRRRTFGFRKLPVRITEEAAQRIKVEAAKLNTSPGRVISELALKHLPRVSDGGKKRGAA